MAKPVPPNSISVHQAFQQGRINPLNLSVQNSKGQFISFEDALATGILHPRSSSVRREGSLARDGSLMRESANQVRAASMPPTGSSYSFKKQTTHQSGGMHMPTQRGATTNGFQTLNGANMVNGGAHLKPGMGTLPPNFSPNTPTQQRRVWEKQQQQQHHHHSSSGTNPASFYHDLPAQSQSPLLNGNAHFINGKLFASRPGYQIEGNGAVINTMTGESISLTQAQRMNIVQQIPDDEYDAGTLPPSNSMFNRVSGYSCLLIPRIYCTSLRLTSAT